MTHRSLVACALLAGTCLSAQAHAQAFAVAPPQRVQIDSNGVDHVKGTALLSQKLLSIGPDGPGGLSLTYWFGPGSGGSNWGISLYASGSTYTVGLGATGDVFTQSGSTFTSNAGNGSTLVLSGGVYTYTNGAGVKITFGALPGDPTVKARATKVLFPTGETDTLTWNQVTYCADSNLDGCPSGNYATETRLQAVTSSTGYQLHFRYQVDNVLIYTNGPKWANLQGISAINLALDYCDPAAGTCSTPNQTPAAVAVGSSLVGNTTTTTITDPMGRVTKYQNGPGLFQVQKPTASTWDIQYTVTTDATFQVTQVVRDGMTYNYAPSLASNVRTLTITDPLSHTATTTADTTIGQILTSKDGLNRTTTYTYDAGGNLLTATAPEGNKITYTRDGRGNATTTTYSAKPGTGLTNITTSAVYPTTCTNVVTCNLPTSVTDANSHTTSYTYDPTHGGVLTVTQPAVGGVSPQTRLTYTALQAYYKNSAGSIVASGVPAYRLTGTSVCQTTGSCTGGADETKSTISYGSTGVANNLLPTSLASGAGNGSLTATRSMTYDAAGNPYTSTDALGRVTRYRYDADRELVGVVGTDPDGSGTLKNRAQRYTYNADGLVTLAEQGTAASQSDADWTTFVTLQQVASAYDAADRKTQDSAQAGGTTYAVAQYVYDGAGRLQCSAQRMNPSVFGSLPSSACTQGTAGSYGPDRIVLNTYDSADELTQVTSGYGVSGSQRNETTYTYSANGKVKTLADARNNLTTYVYDGFDRLYQTQYPSPTTAGSSNTADYEQLGYDAAGNITSRRLRDGTGIGYGYDALNRLNSKTLPAGEHGVTYAYDNLGHPKTITGATTLSYVWDALGRMTSETQAYGSVAYQYDLGNRRTQLTWQDSTYLTYGYDNVDEMTAIHENGAAANLVAFSYDDLGQRKTRTLANGTSTTYGYDAISRLTSLALAGGTNANTATLSNFSPAGEIGARANSNDAFAWTQGANVNRGYTINGLNQFATIAGATQGYDGRGNLTSSGGTTYAYTAENLLKSVSTGQTLTYDPIGRLGEYDAPTATRFVYDGGMISEELNTSGAVLRRYVFGPAGDEPIVWYEGSGTATKRYIDQDERGSVTRITNQDGSTYAVNSYDEYGIPGASNQGRFGYTGQAWLSEIGLAYYKARIYSPTLGRFMQTDPIGYEAGENLYNYVAGDPINFVDPTGMATACTAIPPNAPPNCKYFPEPSSGKSPANSLPSTDPECRIGDVKCFEHKTKPQDDQQKKVYCNGLNKAVADTQKNLGSYETQSARWNSVSTLQFDRGVAQSDIDEDTFVANVTFAGGAGLTAGALRWKALGSRGFGVAGLIAGIAGEGASLDAGMKQAQIDALNARINQLNAQAAGVCPKSGS